MYEQSSRSELDLLELKTTSIKHIVYGIVLISIISCSLFLLFYALVGYFVIFIVVTPGLGLWFLYDGINRYKKYKRIKKGFEPPELFT
jgi:hypothetical protein